MGMQTTEATQQNKPIGERNGNAVASIALLLRPSPSPAQPSQKAGVLAFITPNGLTVIRFADWSKIIRRAQQLRQQGVSATEIVAFVSQKARELEAKFGWLKRLWAARLQRVLRRLALQRGLPNRWDGKNEDWLILENFCFFAVPILTKSNRSPPESPADSVIKPSPSFITPSVPCLLRAPTFCCPAGVAGGG